MLEQFLPLLGILRPDEDFQQIVQIPFDPFPQHEAVVPRELPRVIARPQNQVIRLRDDYQFLYPFSLCHVRCSLRTLSQSRERGLL